MELFDTKRFITEIEKRPSLWDCFCVEYCDRDLKKESWAEMVDIFGGKSSTASERKELGDSLQKRWKNVRGCYTREISRKRTLKCGYSTGSRKSEYTYFQQLQFLRKVVAISGLDSSEEYTEDSPDNEMTPNRLVKRRKNEKETVPADDTIMTDTAESVENREVAVQDDDKLFLLSLLGALKKVPENRKMATKIKIMSMLDNAAFSLLEETGT